MKKIISIFFVVFAVFMSVNVYADINECSFDSVPACCWAADSSSDCQSCPDWQDERLCYIEIPLEIGTDASFNDKSADDNGIVKEKMYYKDHACDAGTVFAHDNDMNQLWSFCEGYYERDGIHIPIRNDYTFAGWKLCNTCDDDDCETIDNDTDLVPLWDEDGQLCKKIVAVWCDIAGHEVPDPNNQGKCVCAQGYYSTDSGCTKCPDGKTTSGIGESECKYLFKYGTNKTWTWPDNISVGGLADINGLP